MSRAHKPGDLSPQTFQDSPPFQIGRPIVPWSSERAAVPTFRHPNNIHSFNNVYRAPTPCRRRARPRHWQTPWSPAAGGSTSSSQTPEPGAAADRSQGSLPGLCPPLGSPYTRPRRVGKITGASVPHGAPLPRVSRLVPQPRGTGPSHVSFVLLFCDGGGALGWLVTAPPDGGARHLHTASA